MVPLIRLELRKAVANRWFYLAFAIGCALAVASALGCLAVDVQSREYLGYMWSHFMPLSTISVFRYWIVNDASQPATDLFFLLLPLLALLPYSWSLLVERNTGYSQHILARSGRVRYYVAKHLAAFLSGGSVVTVPILLNFCICMCFSPFYIPDVSGVVTLGIFEESLWSEVYYNNPGLYCLFRVMLVFAFSGLWSAFVMSLSFVVRKRIPLLIAPYLSLILLKFVNGHITVLYLKEDLTPFGYLRSISTSCYVTSWWVIAVELAVLLSITCALIIRNREKDIL